MSLLARLITGGLVALALAGCDWHLPGKPIKPVEPVAGSRAEFDRLYFVHCLGCHGPEGRNGPARPMNDPLYLAVISDETFERVTTEGHGVLMPGFKKTPFSGMTTQQIKDFTTGIKRFWGDSKKVWKDLPAYAQPAGSGDVAVGGKTFATYCGSCHGTDGSGKSDGAGSVVNKFYLDLVSDQALRSTVIFGRTDLGCPDFRGPYPGHPEGQGLTPADIDNVTAWLVSNRVNLDQEAAR